MYIYIYVYESSDIHKTANKICDRNEDGDGKTRKEINEYIYPILNETISRMDSRVRTALTYLRTKEFIENSGTDTKPIWIKK